MKRNFFQEKNTYSGSALELAGKFCSTLLSLASRKEVIFLMLMGAASAECTWGCWIIDGTLICGMQCG